MNITDIFTPVYILVTFFTNFQNVNDNVLFIANLRGSINETTINETTINDDNNIYYDDTSYYNDDYNNQYYGYYNDGNMFVF